MERFWTAYCQPRHICLGPTMLTDYLYCTALPYADYKLYAILPRSRVYRLPQMESFARTEWHSSAFIDRRHSVDNASRYRAMNSYYMRKKCIFRNCRWRWTLWHSAACDGRVISCIDKTSHNDERQWTLGINFKFVVFIHSTDHYSCVLHLWQVCLFHLDAIRQHHKFTLNDV